MTIRYCGGGGGYGSPLERDVEKVYNEVLDELLSVERAREDYGVVIDPETLLLDEEATKILRKKMLENEQVIS